ncbi:MAG: PKD-like family lipoprotein [Mangrovibacterium sp.]
MKEYIKTKGGLLIAAVFLLASCMEEQGNYIYTDVNEVKIDSVLRNYSCLQFDSLHVVPKLTFTQDSSNCAYKWEALQSGDIGGDKVIPLSAKRNLEERITLIPGAYDVYYTVKDLNTQIQFQQSFKLHVTTSVYEGWLLLTDTQDAPRLDMISIINDELTPLYGVTEGSGLELSGDPGFVYTYDGIPGFYCVYVSTSGNGTVKLQPNDFSWEENYNLSNEFVINQPVDLEAASISGGAPSWGYVNVEGDIYHYYKPWSKYYGATINHINDEPFKASPQMVSENAWGYAIFYDETNKRFVRSAQTSGMTTVMPNPAEETRKFDYTTGMDLVYMTSNNFTNSWYGSVFAILNEPATNKNYLAFFISWSGEQKYYGEIDAIDFDQATSYAVSPSYGYLFYAVGSKVYQYDFNNKKNIEMLDLAPRQVSLIKFENFYNNKYGSNRNRLVVCSYDPSGEDGSNGTFELYRVPEVNGMIELEESYEGFGKIVSVAYRER